MLYIYIYVGYIIYILTNLWHVFISMKLLKLLTISITVIKTEKTPPRVETASNR